MPAAPSSPAAARRRATAAPRRQSAAGNGRTAPPVPRTAPPVPPAPPGRRAGRSTAEIRRDRRLAARRRLRRRRLVILAVVLCGLLIAGASPLDWWIRASSDEVAPPPEPAPPADPAPASVPSAAPDEPEETEVPPVLSLPGDFPVAGPGTFTFAAGEGEVLGEVGTIRRFRVAVEDGLRGEDVAPEGASEATDPTEVAAEFAAFVDETVGHEQGWAAGGDVQFQRVPDGAGHDFTIYLVTSQTAGQICGAAGLNVLAPGLPEGGVSCRTGGQAIINLSRWLLSVEHYVDAGVPLETYRQMVLNHEIGHELGYGHYGCPGPGEPAPLMQQQTLFLDGCEANPWPYLDGVHHTGPAVP